MTVRIDLWSYKARLLDNEPDLDPWVADHVTCNQLIARSVTVKDLELSC